MTLQPELQALLLSLHGTQRDRIQAVAGKVIVLEGRLRDATELLREIVEGTEDYKNLAERIQAFMKKA